MEKEIEKLVHQSRLFEDVSAEGFGEVISLGIFRSRKADSFFFLQGDPATHAYVLIKGRVKMMQITPNGQQIALRIMTPGQTYGGIAMLNPKAGYPATAQAEEDSVALAWETAKLRQLAQKEPKLSLNVMSLMHGYISELQERQKALLTDRVEQRIARILLKLSTECGKQTDEGILINLALTRQDIAEMSGTTLFTVSRTLNEWDRDGLLKIGRERVVICDAQGLLRLANTPI